LQGGEKRLSWRGEKGGLVREKKRDGKTSSKSRPLFYRDQKGEGGRGDSKRKTAPRKCLTKTERGRDALRCEWHKENREEGASHWGKSYLSPNHARRKGRGRRDVKEGERIDSLIEVSRKKKALGSNKRNQWRSLR